MEWVNANASSRWGSPDPFPPGGRAAAAAASAAANNAGNPPHTGDLMSRPTSPDGLGGGLYSSYTMGTGLEGLICASPSAVRQERGPRSVSKCNSLHAGYSPSLNTFLASQIKLVEDIQGGGVVKGAVMCRVCY